MGAPGILKKWIRLFSFDILGTEERFKRLFLAICMGMLVPVTLLFGTQNLLASRINEAIIVYSIGVLLTGLTIVLSRARTHYRATRFVIISLSLLLYYELYIGGGNGGAFLWFFTFPISIIFLLGFKEGLHWIGGQIIILSILIFGKIGHEYSVDLGIRIISLYIVLSALATSFELLRARYLAQLVEEKAILQKALDEIKILKGMVPICSSCKKIRDDKGFWTQIESYMKEHADVEFSHGICPECATRLFPSAREQTSGSGTDGQETSDPLDVAAEYR